MDPLDADTENTARSSDSAAQSLEAAIAEGDLARAYRERIRLFALRRLGDAAAAEDVAQETLRRVIDACRAGRIHTPDALPAFVFGTARHVCLHHVRGAAREDRAFRRLTPAGQRALDEMDALKSLIADERLREVRKALARLPDDDRELLRLVYYEQLPTDELARRLGLTPGAVRVRKHRALRQLAELLREEG